VHVRTIYIVIVMKIRLSELRRLIRESLTQQSVVPGRWDPSNGEPVDSDDIALMSTGGLGKDDLEDEDAID